MLLRLFFVIALIALGGCDLSIKNGLFACGQVSDCPSGYFCWSSDNRCYDSKEPGCEPKSCEQVVAEFASVGIVIECGSLPDGCDGSIACGACPAGTVCGANGQNFACGCEEVTCASEDAECGPVATRCGGDEAAIDCGGCLGNRVCADSKCVCPPGEQCAGECGGRCTGGEVCVDGECCTPAYPCLQNECSPTGGLPDGCGGVAVCPSCQNDEQCVFSDDLVFECLGNCTCEARGVECGSASICGSPKLCGTCQDNGFEDGYRCDGGRCTCEDAYESNDTFETVALVCGEAAGGVNCMQDAWSVDLQASLHSEKDIDFFALEVKDAATPIIIQTYDSEVRHVTRVAYFCPDGYSGIAACSGWMENVEGVDFCSSTEDVLGIERRCEPKVEPSVGTLLIRVAPDDYPGDCNDYGLKVVATFATELPEY